jgi:hypothetical protein
MRALFPVSMLAIQPMKAPNKIHSKIHIKCFLSPMAIYLMAIGHMLHLRFVDDLPDCRTRHSGNRNARGSIDAGQAGCT